MVKKNWIIKEQGDPREIEFLSQTLGLSRSISCLLVQRGIKSYEDARSFFVLI